MPGAQDWAVSDVGLGEGGLALVTWRLSDIRTGAPTDEWMQQLRALVINHRQSRGKRVPGCSFYLVIYQGKRRINKHISLEGRG